MPLVTLRLAPLVATVATGLPHPSQGHPLLPLAAAEGLANGLTALVVPEAAALEVELPVLPIQAAVVVQVSPAQAVTAATAS